MREEVAVARIRQRKSNRAANSLYLLKLDIDAGQPVPLLGTILKLLRRSGYRVGWLMQKRSRSGKGWHLVLATVPVPQTPMEVVALQAILGSDPAREACNVVRARVFPKVPQRYRSWWNVLYN